MGNGLKADGFNGAGRRRVNGYAHAAGHVGYFLAFEDSIADCNTGFGRLAYMLLQRQYQNFWQAGASDRA